MPFRSVRAARRRTCGVAVLEVLLALSLLLGSAWVADHWEPDLPVQALEARYAPPPSQWLPLGGLRVHLRDEGPRDDPVPVVLVHGTAASLHTWEGWVAELRRDRRVISMDLPGFGLTGPVPDGDYSIAAYVRFLAALLDALQVRRVVLAGNSLGGEIAWQFALAHPQRVDRLILVDAAGYGSARGSDPPGFRIARAPGVPLLVRSLLPRELVEASLRSVYGDPSRVTPDLVDRYFDLARRDGNRAALVKRFETMTPGADAARIREVAAPTLVIWGGRDRLIPPSDGERFARDIAGSRLVVFGELGHVPHEEDTAATVRAAREFLAAP
jgi:pimeloyl-ACP methyl ester carboxylesterase